jgi:response regulator RpfG family c-di-GMP phosphodiesterase
MTAKNYLVVSESARARDALAVLLRSRGHAVTVVPSGADAVQVLRGTRFECVLILADENSLDARNLRGRLLREQGVSRVLSVNPVSSGAGAQRVQRFGIGDYRLNEPELVALLEAGEATAAAPGESEHAEPGVDALIEVVNVLVGLRELNDAYHRGSTFRATTLVRAVAERLKLPAQEIREVVLATLLRDVGKIEIEDLCNESQTFTAKQRSRMQEHVQAGVRLLEHVQFPWAVLPIIRHHHEHYDGTGYPGGLRGPEIPLGARIVAAVDAFVAMRSDRPHRAGASHAEAQAELIRQAGRQFDPEVVEILLEVVRDGAVSLSNDERPRVLIADPEMEFVKLLKFRLVNEGHEVDTVTSVEEAILRVIEQSPSIVLAGVGSDGERTLHLLREVREDRDLRLTPVVLLAETEDRVFKLRALRQGADDYLVKSVGFEEIVARIDSILARETMRRTKAEAPRSRGITGELENLSLPDIFQTLNLGLKTARVKLSTGDREGTIWFSSGTAVHAEVGETLGVPACYEMLRWKDGQFCIQHGLEADETSIEMDTMFMVMEGLRLLDEAAGGVASDPAPTA